MMIVSVLLPCGVTWQLWALQCGLVSHRWVHNCLLDVIRAWSQSIMSRWQKLLNWFLQFITKSFILPIILAIHIRLLCAIPIVNWLCRMLQFILIHYRAQIVVRVVMIHQILNFNYILLFFICNQFFCFFILFLFQFIEERHLTPMSWSIGQLRIFWLYLWCNALILVFGSYSRG